MFLPKRKKKKNRKPSGGCPLSPRQCSISFPVAVSPVGGAALNVAPALPLWEDPGRGPRTSKGIELHPLPLLSGVVPEGLGRHRWLKVLGRAPFRVYDAQPVVGVLVVVPEGSVLRPVLDAELNDAGGSEVLGHEDGEGEGVRVGAAVDVVHVQAGDVLEGAPGVEGDPDPHPLLEGEVLDLDRPREQKLPDGAGL